MMRAPILVALLVTACLNSAFTQTPPWDRPLMHAWSTDGITFSAPSIFQDSSGVPSVIRWQEDTLICAFQWFRQPMGSASWDRVAVKFSYDDGASWTVPTPIVIDLPPGYQRPFDPTLVKLGGDSLRIYFSSSATPPMGLDASVNTYSAVGTDGINWSFEPGARVDHATLPIIDPAVIRFGPGWHYGAPKGAPQDGAHHFLSPDGISFNQVPDITSDPQHNWTGNFMIESAAELRFYGSSGPFGIWYNSSPNGGQWNGYVNTNLQGGDPSALKVAPGIYLIVYVGQPYSMGLAEDGNSSRLLVHPVPTTDRLRIDWPGHVITSYALLAVDGTVVMESASTDGAIDLSGLTSGAYLLEVRDRDGKSTVARVLRD